MGFDIVNFDFGNWTIGLNMADSGIGVDMCYVALRLEEFDGCGSVGVHSIINLQDDEGAGWIDGKVGEGFNAGMRRVADCRNHVMILSGQVDLYETEANAYGGGCHVS